MYVTSWGFRSYFVVERKTAKIFQNQVNMVLEHTYDGDDINSRMCNMVLEPTDDDDDVNSSMCSRWRYSRKILHEDGR